MKLDNHNINGGIDLLEFVDTDENLLVYAYHGRDNNLKINALLSVSKNQQAVFISEKKIADIFTAGEYILNMRSLPILSTYQGWKYGFNSSFNADVLFINVKEHTDLTWQTELPIVIGETDNNKREIKAFGKFSFQIIDSKIYATTFSEGHKAATVQQVQNKLIDLFSAHFAQVAKQKEFDIDTVLKQSDLFSSSMEIYLKNEFITSGIDITNFTTENISLHQEELDSIIDSAVSINLEEIAKMKAEKEAAKVTTIQTTQFAEIEPFNSAKINNKSVTSIDEDLVTQLRDDEKIVPPPLPQTPKVRYYVAIDNKQTGPYDWIALKNLADDGKLTCSSLVWTKGLTQWEKAENQPELNILWKNN